MLNDGSAGVIAWIRSNIFRPESKFSHLDNYFTPLTSQVDALVDHPLERICSATTHLFALQSDKPYRNKPQQKNAKVGFTLQPGHTDKDGKEWRSSPWSRTTKSFDQRYWECAKSKLATRKLCQWTPSVILPAHFTEAQLKRSILYGSIASVTWDTTCTSNAGKIGDPFIQTNQTSTKVFPLADGHPNPSTNIAIIQYWILHIPIT